VSTQFINPFDLLDLDTSAVPSAVEVQRAKRRGLLEFDLSESNSVEIAGRSIQRSDFINSSEDLADPKKREFYAALHERFPDLNRFLSTGEVGFFQNYQHESLFNHTPFVEFVGPYFAHQYNRVLKSALKDKNTELVRLLASCKLLVTNDQKSKLYQGAKQYLRHLREELDDLSAQAKQGQESVALYVAAEVKELVDFDLLNALPGELKGSRSEVGKALRNLSVIVFNELGDAKIALRILRKGLKLDVSDVTQKRLRKDLRKIEDIYEQRRLTQKHEDELERCADAITRLVQLGQKSGNSNADPSRISREAKAAIDVALFNGLPHDFVELRNQAALGLRNLATNLWNKHQDIAAAVALMEVVAQLEIDASLKDQLDDDRSTLEQIRKDVNEFEREQMQHLAQHVADTRRTIEKAVRSLTGSVNWHRVNVWVTSTFPADLVRRLERADASDARDRLFSNLAFILSRLKSKGYDGENKRRLRQLVSSSSEGSSTSRRSKTRKQHKARSSTSRSTSARQSTPDVKEGNNKGCIIVAIIVIIIFLISSAS